VIIFVGLLGHQHPVQNLAPVAVWVIGWVGLAFVASLLCDPWPAVNPWRIPMRWVGARGWFRWPRWIGRWPAVLLMALFAWAELVWPARERPEAIALALVGYTGLTCLGAALFGYRRWLRRAEVFAQVFSILGRFAPMGRTPSGGVRLRLPGAGLLAARPANAATTALILLVLATVTFDGLLETPLWRGIAETALASETLVMIADASGAHPYVALATGAMATFSPVRRWRPWWTPEPPCSRNGSSGRWCRSQSPTIWHTTSPIWWSQDNSPLRFYRIPQDRGGISSGRVRGRSGSIFSRPTGSGGPLSWRS